MTANEKFLTQRQRYQPVTLPQDFSDAIGDRQERSQSLPLPQKILFYKNAAENCELPHKIINSPDTASFPVQIFFQARKKNSGSNLLTNITR
ncbi:hypothetical protein [Thiolapillus sp.]|uniref:hypothetical protein n=2 Tax=Thiolapillus sp. TaxID=2017437 RepID=UPI003AF4F72D